MDFSIFVAFLSSREPQQKERKKRALKSSRSHFTWKIAIYTPVFSDILIQVEPEMEQLSLNIIRDRIW